MRRSKGPVLSFEFKTFRPEVEQESGFYFCRRQAIDQLSLMGGMERGDDFKFQDQTIFHNDIRQEISDHFAVKINRQGFLTSYFEPQGLETNQERIVVNRLQETWAERAMNNHRFADDFLGKRVGWS